LGLASGNKVVFPFRMGEDGEKVMWRDNIEWVKFYWKRSNWRKRREKGRDGVELKAYLSYLNKPSLSYCHSFTPRWKGISLGSAKDKESIYSGSFSLLCEWMRELMMGIAFKRGHKAQNMSSKVG